MVHPVVLFLSIWLVVLMANVARGICVSTYLLASGGDEPPKVFQGMACLLGMIGGMLILTVCLEL